ncbi:hypothetical protein WDZ92_04300 [Nostoc sp. NIES-2111]
MPQSFKKLDSKKYEELIDRKTAAKRLKMAPGTLAAWDSTKRYDLKPIKIGRTVRYRPSVIDRFIDERMEM